MRCRSLQIATALVASLILFTSFAATVEGTVKYSDGKPAPATVVYALNGRKPLVVRNNRILLGGGLPRAITDRSGKFSIDCEAGNASGFLAQDMKDATAYLPMPAAGGPITLTIMAPARAEVAVYNGDAGAAGELVRAVQDSKDVVMVYEGRTGVNGALALKPVSPGDYVVSTWHEVPQVGCCFRSVATRMAKVSLNSGQEETIKLGGTDLPRVAGKISDTTGQALHGVWVSLNPKLQRADGSATNIAWSTVSERDGSYAIFDVPPGDYDLRMFRRLAANDSARTFESIQPIRVATEPTAAHAYDFKIDLAPFMPLEPGKAAPEISGTTLSGETFSLAKLKGKPVVVHFYAAWCTPCVQTIGEFDALADEIGRDKLEVVGISLDQTEEEARAFASEKNLHHPVLYQGTWAVNPIREAYRVVNIPTTVIIGADGAVAHIDLFGDVLKSFIKDGLL